MIRVERATAADFEPVLPLLETFNNPAITRDHWRRLFHLPWPCADDTRGFVLRDGERVAGFFGALFSERSIDGRPEKFANFTSWVTHPDYRNHSLHLFKAVASIPDRTLTCMTVHPSVAPLYRRFGFQELDSRAVVLLPVPWPLAPASWWKFRIHSGARAIRQRLDPQQRDLFDHHAAEPCRHLLIRGRDRSCHIIFTRTKGRRRHLARIHHISDVDVFLANLDRIRLHLVIAARAAGVLIDSRFLRGARPRWSREVDSGCGQVFKSATLRAEQIDNLYSELVLLPL